MSRNLGTYQRLARLFLAAFLFFAAGMLFQHPIARLLAVAFGAYSLWECFAAKCPLHAALGVTSAQGPAKPEAAYLIGLLGVQAVLAYEWWSAGWEKVSTPDFVANIGKTLGAFASKNPFPWYKGFLEGVVMKNSTVFAYAVEYGQIIVALTLIAAAAAFVYVKNANMRRWTLIFACLALFGGMLMNANFYLAAGWTGPGTKGTNVVMFWTQAMLIHTWLSIL